MTKLSLRPKSAKKDLMKEIERLREKLLESTFAFGIVARMYVEECEKNEKVKKE